MWEHHRGGGEGIGARACERRLAQAGSGDNPRERLTGSRARMQRPFEPIELLAEQSMAGVLSGVSGTV